MMTAWPIPSPDGRIPETSDLCPPEPELVVCDCGGSCWWDDDADLWTCNACDLTYDAIEPDWERDVPDDEPDDEDDPRSPRRVQTMQRLTTATKGRGWWRWG